MATLLSFSPSQHLGAVLAAVAAQSAQPQALFIHENGDVEYLLRQLGVTPRTGHLPVQVLPSTGNLGVGGGHNRLIRAAIEDGADWIWMLEHDTLPDPICLQSLIEQLDDGDELLGVLVPNLARDDSERSWAAEQARMAEDTPASRTMTFNAVLVSARALLDVGLLREDLFVGGEDLDLSARLLDAGWHIRQLTPVTGLHPTRGDRRHGVEQSVSRQYYSVRSAVLRERPILPRLWMAARLLLGMARDLLRPAPFRRMRARFRAVLDGALGRGGERHYRFMDE